MYVCNADHPHPAGASGETKLIFSCLAPGIVTELIRLTSRFSGRGSETSTARHPYLFVNSLKKSTGVNDVDHRELLNVIVGLFF